MRGWSRRALVGMLVLVLLVAGAAASSGATVRGPSVRAPGGRGLDRCVKAVLGLGPGRAARPVAGSADPTVISSIAVFRRHRSAAGRLAAADLGAELGTAGARTYDPSAAVRLLHSGGRSAVYAVPATVAIPTLPAGCSARRQLAGVDAYLALRSDTTGSGPGACLIAVQRVPNPPGLPLPGKARPEATLDVTGASCESGAVLSSYAGALGGGNGGPASGRALIPDGISSISYTLSDGRVLTASVAGNLVTLPAALSSQKSIPHPSANRLRRRLAARLPTTITETGAGGEPLGTFTRPVSLIHDSVGAFSFLRRLVTLGRTSSGSATSTAPSCTARTHRCVAVTVTMTCSGERHCRIARRIDRYRYVTAKPPAGTTGRGREPTGLIVARMVRLVTRPIRPALVLRGAPHRSVDVLLVVMCFGRHSTAGVSGQPLTVPVPSRTPIPLHGGARGLRGCDVGALVISRKQGPVHAILTRG